MPERVFVLDDLGVFSSRTYTGNRRESQLEIAQGHTCQCEILHIISRTAADSKPDAAYSHRLTVHDSFPVETWQMPMPRYKTRHGSAARTDISSIELEALPWGFQEKEGENEAASL